MGAARLRRHRDIPYEGQATILLPLEQLRTVVVAVADIEMAVLRRHHAMDDAAENRGLRVRRLAGVHGMTLVECPFQHRSAGRLAIGTPSPLIAAGLGVEADDAPVGIAIGHQHHAVRMIDVGRIAQLVGRIVATGLLALPKAADKLALGTIIHDHMVAAAIAAEPDAAGLVHEDAMQAARPLADAIDGWRDRRPAPAADIAAILAEAHHRRRRFATGGDGRCLSQARIRCGQAMGSMHDPDRIVRPDCHAAHLTQQQVVGHGRPGGIDLESRHLRAGRCHLFERQRGERRRWRCRRGGQRQDQDGGEEGAHGDEGSLIGKMCRIMPVCPLRSMAKCPIFKEKRTGRR